MPAVARPRWPSPGAAAGGRPPRPTRPASRPRLLVAGDRRRSTSTVAVAALVHEASARRASRPAPSPRNRPWPCDDAQAGLPRHARRGSGGAAGLSRPASRPARATRRGRSRATSTRNQAGSTGAPCSSVAMTSWAHSSEISASSTSSALARCAKTAHAGRRAVLVGRQVVHQPGPERLGQVVQQVAVLGPGRPGQLALEHGLEVVAVPQRLDVRGERLRVRGRDSVPAASTRSVSSPTSSP